MTHGTQCEFEKKDGSRCRANTRSSSSYCFFHDPSVSRERHSARRRGGIARTSQKLTLPADTPHKALASVTDVLSLLEATANEVRRGQLETRLANCVGYLCSVALNGLAQIPGPDSPVSVSFVVQAPMPCPICKTETGKACAQCQGMGYVSASKQPSETVS
jgi:hypothetical protein